jgi:transposase
MSLLRKGIPQAEVARECKVSRTSVFRWKEELQVRRKLPWKRKALGRPPRITSAHLRKLQAAMEHGAQAHGFLNDLWTLPRAVSVLEKECGVHCHPAHLWKLLGRMGWSCQRPTGKAVERDEDAIARWKRYTWPALKKRPNMNAGPSSLLTKAD